MFTIIIMLVTIVLAVASLVCSTEMTKALKKKRGDRALSYGRLVAALGLLAVIGAFVGGFVTGTVPIVGLVVFSFFLLGSVSIVGDLTDQGIFGTLKTMALGKSESIEYRFEEFTKDAPEEVSEKTEAPASERELQTT